MPYRGRIRIAPSRRAHQMTCALLCAFSLVDGTSAHRPDVLVPRHRRVEALTNRRPFRHAALLHAVQQWRKAYSMAGVAPTMRQGDGPTGWRCHSSAQLPGHFRRGSAGGSMPAAPALGNSSPSGGIYSSTSGPPDYATNTTTNTRRDSRWRVASRHTGIAAGGMKLSQRAAAQSCAC